MASPPAASGLTSKHDFLWGSEATIMSAFGNCAGLYLAPPPSTGEGGSQAGTIQHVFFGRTRNRRYQERAVTVRTVGKDVPSVAPRTLHAMSNAVAHHLCTRSSPEDAHERTGTPCTCASHNRFIGQARLDISGRGSQPSTRANGLAGGRGPKTSTLGLGSGYHGF